MEILNELQYNQTVGRYKVLSSNAGVGSIITTKDGFFIMPQSVSLWGFIKNVNKYIQNHPDDYETSSIAQESGVDIINDPRFIDFLREEQKLSNLRCLVDIPILELTEHNLTRHEENPLYKKYFEYIGAKLEPDHFLIPAIHFPRWFYSSKVKLFKELKDWQNLWKQNRCNGGDIKYFVPPRDPYSKTNRKFKDNNRVHDIYNTLVQVPMLLICKNGHISDIPWYQLFCAGIDGHKRDMDIKDGFELFEYQCRPCSKGGEHELQWIENRTQSESWGVIKCRKCEKNYSLEGIMNIKPFCPSETPWNGIGTKSKYSCKLPNGKHSTMQLVLTTSNSVYYADSFSSLFIPCCYLKDKVLDSKQSKVHSLIVDKWYPKALSINELLTKDEFIRSINLIDKADDAGITITKDESQNIINYFLQSENKAKDTREQYRYDEFKIFSNYSRSLDESKDLEFADIILPEILKTFFNKIQQVNTLGVTGTQLGFYRVSLPSPKRINGVVVRELGQTIFSEDNKEDVFVLPAIQIYGEGLFFEFNHETISQWVIQNRILFSTRYNQDPGELGKSLKDEMDDYGAPMFYLLHTFSHLILKELEFNCGYPTSSLKERIYYSDRMCGVLIYSADGSEGSMGGLVWQGQPKLIEKIILSALERAKHCSSDPLCWEANEQLNLAACFSCCLVSETTCEQRNLGLDRRALVDEEFGFFRSVI
jgi:hypothetical protein